MKILNLLVATVFFLLATFVPDHYKIQILCVLMGATIGYVLFSEEFKVSLDIFLRKHKKN